MADAKTASDTVVALIRLAGELAQLLEKETTLVKTLKIPEIAPLQSEKTRLTTLFQTQLKQIAAAAPLPDAQRKQWLAAGKRLSDAAVANERALRVGRAATQSLIGAIVSAVKQARRPAAAYSARRGAQRVAHIAGFSLDRKL
jgi:hypothetical protein